MKTTSRFREFFSILAVVGTLTGMPEVASAQVTSLIAAGSQWKVLDNGTTPASNWTSRTFVDTSWRNVTSSFGYKTNGNPVNNGATSALNFNTGNVVANPKWITTYFRKSFALGAPATLPVALLTAARWDDGFVVYINGTEMYRKNMPAGAISGSTPASGEINAQAGLYPINYIVPSGVLVANTNNTIAVELHQGSATTTDAFFDFTMGGTTTLPCFGDATVGVYQDFEEGVEPMLTANHFGYLRASNHTLLQYETWVDKHDTNLGYTPPLALLSPNPGDSRQLAFNTNSKFVVETERIDTQNFNNIKALVQLRSELGSGNSWATADYFKGTIFTSNDGVSFTPTVWFNYTNIPSAGVPVTLVDENVANHWMVPTNAIRTVTGATNANPIVITCNVAHGYATNDTVTIAGVQGNTAANVTNKAITVISATSFSLNGVAGNAAYTSGGVFLGKASFNATTNPTDWMNLVPAGWSAYNAPPAPGGLTTNIWRSGNLPSASPKGGLGYDTVAAGTDFNPLLDSLSTANVKAEMLATTTPLFAGESRLNMRVPFTFTGYTLDAITKVELQIRYDDAFGAWLNGVKLTASTNPAEPTAATSNPTARTDTDAVTFAAFDVTTLFKANVNVGGTNVLAIRGYNNGANSNDFLLQPRLVIYTPGPPDPNSVAFLDKGGPVTPVNSAALIPNGTRSVKFKFEGTSSGGSIKNFFLDNLKVVGDAIAAVDLGSTIALELPVASFSEALRSPTADADGDGMSNLLEYAQGSDMAVRSQNVTLPNSTVQSLRPMISQNPDGTIQLRFRTLVGSFDSNDLQNGAFEIGDIRYEPQRADVGYYDWESFSQFAVTAPTVSNDDGSQLVTVSTLFTASGLGNHQMFRILITNNRDPWLAFGVTPDNPVCPFPEPVAW